MKYNLHQKVKISLDSRYKHQGFNGDIQMEGTIIKLQESSPYQYKVRWSNDTIDNYREEDLLPFSEEPNYEIY